jgi:hypothetical protein
VGRRRKSLRVVLLPHPVAPPAPSPVDRLDLRVLALAGVRKGRSRFGGRWAYFLDQREIAHLHGSHELDLRLTREVIRERQNTLRADPRLSFRPSPSDWLTVRLRDAKDVEFAYGLFETAWRASQ